MYNGTGLKVMLLFNMFVGLLLTIIDIQSNGFDDKILIIWGFIGWAVAAKLSIGLHKNTDNKGINHE